MQSPFSKFYAFCDSHGITYSKPARRYDPFPNLSNFHSVSVSKDGRGFEFRVPLHSKDKSGDAIAHAKKLLRS